MKLEDILALERDNVSVMHLVRDSFFFFWQAWEFSAFLFVHNFKRYQIHKKHFNKISRELLWLGFPKTVLPELEKICGEKNWAYEKVSENHIAVSGIPETPNFDEWREALVKKISSAEIAKSKLENVPAHSSNAFLVAYKQAYDLAVHINRALVNVSKQFKYNFGERIRSSAVEMVEELHLLSNKLSLPQNVLPKCVEMLHRLRVDLRLVMDLNQLNIKQWGFLNEQIENLLKTLWGEFRRLRLAGENPLQSGGSLPLQFPPAPLNFAFQWWYCYH